MEKVLSEVKTNIKNLKRDIAKAEKLVIEILLSDTCDYKYNKLSISEKEINSFNEQLKEDNNKELIF